MNLVKSKQRVADHGEVFTPAWMVGAMLDLVKGETERIDSRFLEPACGSGNFLVRILQRKLAAVELKFGKSDFEKRHYVLLVNVDNDTLRRIMNNADAMAAVERIEGWRSLGDNIIETIINKSEKVKELKNKAKAKELTEKQKKQLTEEEKEYKSKRKLVQEKLIKFATCIPAFMYLTELSREHAAGHHHEARARLISGRHRPDASSCLQNWPKSEEKPASKCRTSCTCKR